MKKIMVMIAAVAMAAVVQAASFSWQVSTGTTYAGMDVYCIKGTSAAAVIEAFGNTESADAWTGAVAGVSPVTATSGARGAAGGEISGVSAGDKLVFAIVDGGIAEGNKWYVLADYTIPDGSTYEPPTTGAKQKINPGTPTAGVFELNSEPPPTPPVVPEPTSAMLLVLGMAGLALRRKQK